jgi:8-oxo-dGTP pyrophosphatase MutT (NUDIX family)
MPQSQLLHRLRDRLQGPLPGNDAHERMMPATRRTIYRDLVQVPDDAKKSAVMILLYEGMDGLFFPLIERTEYPGVHSKQIGLPGGAWEQEDTDYVQTALRETEEEIGVNRLQVEVIGQLSSLYIPPSNFWVQPVVGLLSHSPKFVPDPSEVASIIETPLSYLVDPALRVESKIKHSTGMSLVVPSFLIHGHVVWGATAMMLSELSELLGE